jgi:hypothetical protein
MQTETYFPNQLTRKTEKKKRKRKFQTQLPSFSLPSFMTFFPYELKKKKKELTFASYSIMEVKEITFTSNPPKECAFFFVLSLLINQCGVSGLSNSSSLNTMERKKGFFFF